MANKLAVLYCVANTLVDGRGGSLIFRQHIQSLALLDNIDLHICLIGHQDQNTASSHVVQSLGVKFYSIEFEISKQRRFLRKKWVFSDLEKLALAFPNTDRAFDNLVTLLKPKIVVLDYLMTALFVPSIFQRSVHRILITLNQESNFYKQMRALGKLGPTISNSFIAQMRIKRFEHYVYNSVNVLVALNGNDFPKKLHPHVQKKIIEPFLDKNLSRWKCSNEMSVFFVGDILHFPNYLAIAWLAEKFSPYLAEIDSRIKIKIIGINDHQIPVTWKQSNIEYLGPSTKEEVEKCFISSRLFIVPIENNFGSKMKVLECLSYGTPLIATREALSGIDFESAIPQFLLSAPYRAAKLVSEIICSEQELNALSMKLTDCYRKFSSERPHRWKDMLENLGKKPLVTRFMQKIFKPGKKIWPLEIGVHKPAWVSISGMYPLEMSNKNLIRWTMPISEIQIPLFSQSVPKKISLDLYGILPPKGIFFKVFANEIEIFQATINRAEYITLSLPNLMRSPLLSIRLESSGFTFPNDLRKLGVAIKSIQLHLN